MSVVTALIGAGLILLALRDVFHTLFHPSGRGSISELLPKVIWRQVFRRLAKHRPGILALGGPTTVLAVISSWTVLLAVGWALVYWPYLPGGFLFATGLEPSNQDGLVDALYLSLVTLATLGYGDITPTGGVLRILAPLEALLGFGLLTAGLSWVLSIYPALSRRRAFAHEISLIRRAESEVGARGMEAETAERVLGDFAARLVSVRTDMVTFPITYYFHSTDEKSSLSANAPYLVRLAERYGGPEQSRAVRLRAAALRGALEDFSSTVASQYLGDSRVPADEILDAYVRDHLREPSRESETERDRAR